MKPRFEGIDCDHLAGMIANLDTKLADYGIDGFEPDYRGAAHAISRAQLRYAAGFESVEVIDDLWSASRCLVGREPLHFLKIPPQRFRTRRVEPIEIASACGDPFITRLLCDGYSISIATMLTDLGSNELKDEIRSVTHYFGGRVRDSLDLAGLGAVVWVAGLSAMLQGFDDEVALGIRVFREALVANQKFFKEDDPHLKRYVLLVEALRCISKGDGSGVAESLCGMLSGHDKRIKQELGEHWNRPLVPGRYLDLSALAVLATSVLCGVKVSKDALKGEAAPYSQVLDVFLSPPTRNAPPPSSVAAKLANLQKMASAELGSDEDGDN